MQSKPLPANLELDALLKRSAETQAAMTPAQKAEQSLRQSVSYVRGEMGIEHPDWSEEKLNEITRHMPQAWALSEIDRLRTVLKEIADMKPSELAPKTMPGIVHGPALLLGNCQRLARRALRN